MIKHVAVVISAAMNWHDVEWVKYPIPNQRLWASNSRDLVCNMLGRGSGIAIAVALPIV